MADFTLNYTGDKLNQLLAKIDNIYAVGDILTTSTNTNPSARFGGTWENVGKSFINTTMTKEYDNDNAEVTLVSVRTNDEIRFRFLIVNKVEINDSTIELCSVDMTEFGLNQADYSYGFLKIIGATDGGNAGVMLDLTSTGVLSTVDRLMSTTSSQEVVAVGNTIYAHATINVLDRLKADSVCDRFQWKRTA